MRWSRPRVTVLAAMCLVAGIATGIRVWMGIMRDGPKAAVYRTRAAEFFGLEQYHRNRAAGLHNQIMFGLSIEQQREKARDEWAMRIVRRNERVQRYNEAMVKFEDSVADYYHGLVSKYERASIYPWETIAPDPAVPGPAPEQPSLAL